MFLWLVAPGLGGCAGEGSYRLHLVFPNEQAAQGVSTVVVWALEPGGHSCEEMERGGLLPEELRELSRLEVESPFDAVSELARVPAGGVLFAAEGRTAGGARLLRGCAGARVRAGATVDVTVELACVCEPVPGSCAPLDEVMGNDIDDDCDGQTDECDTRLDCEDHNGCTQDFCLESSCQWQDWPDTTDCTDQDPCTTGDACLGGICTGTPKDCSAYDGPCAVGACDPDTGRCSPQPADDGTACDDGLYCTVEDVCQAGVCAGAGRDCDDGDGCTLDSCNEEADGCDHELQPKPGAEGPAGEPTCGNGVDDDCDGYTDEEDANCVACSTNAECDDGNPCTDDICNAGDCENTPVAGVTVCDDGLWCTEPDRCTGGVCGGPARDCTQVADACHDGVCDEDGDACVASEKPDGTGCDDGLWCTVSDACNSGVCTGAGRDCDDGDGCTLDSCNEEADGCDHELQPDPGAEGPQGDPTCGNGVDDDCDGQTDTGDPDCSGLVGLTWIEITGGTYMMGSDTGDDDERPVHQVTVPDFEMTETEVTVAQYQACVDDGVCTAPNTGEYCNWEVVGRGDHPVNCVDWSQASDFCTWAGGRLPSEAEWEYAAHSEGQDITYPWGDETATCDYAVMDDGGNGCGEGQTWPVCSKVAGNTEQGLCDIAGNVFEWVQDWYHDSYVGAPVDGSAWESPASDYRVLRGGSWGNNAGFLRASGRYRGNPTDRNSNSGFRCAR